MNPAPHATNEQIATALPAALCATGRREAGKSSDDALEARRESCTCWGCRTGWAIPLRGWDGMSNYMPGSMDGAGLDYDDYADDDGFVTCNDCGGSGTCSDCKGWGDGVNANCLWCDNTSSCPTCHGLGECDRSDLL